MSSQMYQEIILDYYRNPRNKGSVGSPDFNASDLNTLCGDSITISGKVSGGRISEIRFAGEGCAISQAAASMLTEHVKGKNIDEIKSLTKEKVLKMLNIPISPARLKCALLGLKVLKMGAYRHMGEEITREEKASL